MQNIIIKNKLNKKSHYLKLKISKNIKNKNIKIKITIKN